MATDRKAYLREYGRKYRQSEKFKAAQKKYRQSEKFKATQKKYQQSEKRKASQKKYYQSEKYKEYQKNYQKKYRLSEKDKAYRNDYNKKYNRTEKAKIARRKRAKYRFTNDPIFKLNRLIRTRMHRYIMMKSLKKSKRTFEIVGCTPQELRTFIENKFQPGMTWDNHGIYGWHIDHIIPLDSAKSEDEFMKLCHYTNLQPLWAKDNLSKFNKVIPQNSS